jgi:hypothetical protein
MALSKASAPLKPSPRGCVAVGGSGCCGALPANRCCGRTSWRRGGACSRTRGCRRCRCAAAGSGANKPAFAWYWGCNARRCLVRPLPRGVAFGAAIPTAPGTALTRPAPPISQAAYGGALHALASERAGLQRTAATAPAGGGAAAAERVAALDRFGCGLALELVDAELRAGASEVRRAVGACGSGGIRELGCCGAGSAGLGVRGVGGERGVGGNERWRVVGGGGQR